MKSKFHGAQVKVLLAHSPRVSFCIVYGCSLDYNSRGESGNRDHSALCRKNLAEPWFRPKWEKDRDIKIQMTVFSLDSRVQRPTDNNKHDMGQSRPQGQWSSGERRRLREKQKQTNERPNHAQLCRAGEGTLGFDTSSWEREDGE